MWYVVSYEKEGRGESRVLSWYLDLYYIDTTAWNWAAGMVNCSL